MLSCNAMKPGWRFTHKDDGRLAASILFIEAFGSMTGESVIDVVEQDLYSVALSRAELMGWLLGNDRPSLWNQHEAELLNGSSRLGFVQVGVEQPGLPIPRVLPAALQCVGDSIGRFGGTVTGFQVTADFLTNLSDRDCSWYLHHGLTWFDLKVHERIEAVVHLDQSLLGEYDVSTLTQIPHLTLLVCPLWFYRTCSLSTRRHICSDWAVERGSGDVFESSGAPQYAQWWLSRGQGRHDPTRQLG